MLSNQQSRGTTRLPSLVELAVGEHLTTTPYFLVNLIWGILVSLTLSNDIPHDNLSSHLLAIAAAQGVFSLVVAAAYRANLTLKNPIKPGAFIVVFLIAGAIRGALMQFLLAQLQLTVTDNYPYRIYSGVTSIGLSAWFWAVLFGVLAEWRRQSAQLASERRYLEKLQTDVDSQVTSATGAEIDAFRTYLLSNLRLKAKSDATAMRNELTRMVNEVIRPAVDQMLLRRTAVSTATDTDAEERINLRNVISYVSATRSFHPLIQVIPATPAAIASAFVLFGYRNGAQAIALFVIAWPLALMIGRFLLGPLLDRLPPAPRFALLPFVTLAVASPVIYQLFAIPHLRGGQWVWLEFGIYALVTGMVQAIWFAYLAELGRVYRIRDQFIHHIHWKVAEVNSRRWHQQLHFARRVHGELQSEVAAMAIRLERELAKKKTPATTIGDLQATLEQRVQQVFEAPEAGLNPTDVLTEISETWAGICEISVVLEATDASRLATDPIAVETALEVIREAVSNAIRHGRAHQISVLLGFTDETTVRVEVTNDGEPWDTSLIGSTSGAGQNARVGAGSQHLQECTVFHAVSQAAGHTTLVADLPFRG
jgi:signal transduction histidine kinase